MPLIVQRHHPVVYHIGHLENEAHACPVGGGITVTTDPGTWRQIKGANGPEWELSCSDAHWVDMLSFTAQDHCELQQWMMLQSNRYMEPATAFVTNTWSDTAQDFLERHHASLEDATASLGISVADEMKARARGQGAVEEVDTFRLKRRGLKRLAADHDPFDWFSAAAFLYVREVVMVKRPLVVGLWWGEVASRETGTAPHGLLLPEALVSFTVEGDELDEQLFVDAFPTWQLPERKVPLGA